MTRLCTILMLLACTLTAQAGNIIGPAGQWAWYSSGAAYWDDPASNTAVVRWDLGSSGGGTAWTNDSTDYGLWLIPSSGTVSQVAVGTDSFSRVQYAGKYNEASGLRSRCDWYMDEAKYLTVSAWAMATSRPAANFSQVISTYTGSDGWYIGLDAVGTNYAAFLTRYAASDITLATTNLMPLNTWVLLTMTYNANNGTAKLYRNADLLVTSNASDGVRLETSGYITLGKQALATPRYWPGYVGPVRIYFSLVDTNACLSAAAVSNLYTKTTMPNGNTSRAVSFPHVWTDRLLPYRLLTCHFTATNAAGCFTPEDGPGVFSNKLGVTRSAYTNSFGTNGYVHFNGTNYLIDYTLVDSSLGTSTQGAVGVWFRIAHTNALSTLWTVSDENNVVFSQIGVRVSGGGTGLDAFCYKDSVAQWTTSLALGSPLTTGVWYHVVLAHNGTTGGFWLDGVNVGGTGITAEWFKTILTDAVVDADSWTFGIQRYFGASYYPFQGDVAGFQVYTNYCGSPQWHADWKNTFPTNNLEVP